MTAHAKWLGIANPNSYYEPAGIQDLQAFERISGAHVDVNVCFFDLADLLNKWHVVNFNKRGTIPLLTITPAGVNGPDPTQLAAINAGKYDQQITANATTLKGTDHIVRPLHEMNGTDASYSQQPAEFLKAWARIRNLWRKAGNTAPFVWCANNTGGQAKTDFVPYFPGEDQCEIVALDGYSYPLVGNPTFEQVFAQDLAELKALSAHPVLIAETGTHKDSPNRAAWLDGMFAYIAADPRIIGVDYWNRDVYAITDQPTAYHVGIGTSVWRAQ